MRKDSLIKLLVCIVAIVGIFLAFVQPLANSIRQGLDLQGGTHVVLEAEDTPQAQVNDDAMQRVVKIMEKRVNELGLTEPIIQREGARRVIIELPGIKDPDKAIQTIGKTAMQKATPSSRERISRMRRQRRIRRRISMLSIWNSPMKAGRNSRISRCRMWGARLRFYWMARC